MFYIPSKLEKIYNNIKQIRLFKEIETTLKQLIVMNLKKYIIDLPFQTEQFVAEVLEVYQPIIATLIEQFGSEAAKEFAKRFSKSKCLKQRIKMQESANEAQTESITTAD